MGLEFGKPLKTPIYGKVRWKMEEEEGGSPAVLGGGEP